MKAEKFASYLWYQEVIEQELSIMCFKQKLSFFKVASHLFSQLPDRKTLFLT